MLRISHNNASPQPDWHLEKVHTHASFKTDSVTLTGNTPLLNINLGHLFVYPTMEAAVKAAVEAVIEAVIEAAIKAYHRNRAWLSISVCYFKPKTFLTDRMGRYHLCCLLHPAEHWSEGCYVTDCAGHHHRKRDRYFCCILVQ